jgi:hypothetical protein
MVSATSTKSLKTFFMGLMIPNDIADYYASRLFEIGIRDEKDLRKFVNIATLQKIGARSTDIQSIMHQLFIIEEGDMTEQFFSGDSGMQPVPQAVNDMTGPYVRRLTRDALIRLEEVGRGVSGCVSKTLFVPTLTFLAIKSIEIKEAITRKIVGPELKVLYEVARYFVY